MAPVVLLAAAPALAQLPPHPISTKESRRGDPESERWATITHAGNEAYIVPGIPGVTPDWPIGRVDYEYQISRTEWIEFVRAYAPYVSAADLNITFTSGNIGLVNGPGREFFIWPGWEHRAVGVTWRYAARYANWLHNGKRPERAAFESGAYDTSTFGDNPDGSFNDQIAHSTGARYWLPTVDEWVKAAFYDPDKNGPGMPGYWQYPTTSDTFATPGPPELGGQTSAGYNWSNYPGPRPDVGAYHDVQSPWGLWDCSGGVTEWTESVYYQNTTVLPDRRFYSGTPAGGSPTFASMQDQIGGGSGATWLARLFGVRVARAIPSSPTLAITAAVIPLSVRRRRRSNT